ncbi:MAG: hypothetical protein JHC57_21535, partial [Sphingopyxis sp.]|nr:hypothetical protein [Sphingopyxis sp.]
MARKFLYVIAAIILLILAAGVVYQLFPGWIARTAFVPSTEFKPQAAVAPNAYDDPKMWFAHPGMEKDPSAWRPAADGSETPGTELPGEKTAAPLIPPAEAAQAAAETPVAKGDAAVFFVHPTSYYSRS